MSLDVLIIEDNINDQMMLKEKMEEMLEDCQIAFALTGEEGIEIAKKEKPGIVLIDAILPKIDGFEACRQIKEIDNPNPKIIICTGSVDGVNAYKAREVGADDCCVKTADWASVVNCIKKLIDKE